jgi:zinc and cadmium transporter
MSAVIYSLVSTIIISLISLVVALPFLIKKKVHPRTLLVLLSLSVGTLFGGVFIHFLPETIENGFTLKTSLTILSGILMFFIIEKLVHSRHSCKKKHSSLGHGHAYHLAPINIIGDAVHNFLDGLVIAGSYIANIPLGIAATISVIFHELPQEMADIGILLYSGVSKKKAVMFNLLSAFAAIIGAIFGLILAGKTNTFSNFIIPFAAGNFIYIAGSNLIPELHQYCKLKDTLMHLVAILLGIAIMIGISVFEFS